MTTTTTRTGTSRDPSDHVMKFIDDLEGLERNENRAALAKLRRSLIDYGRDFSAYTVLGYSLPANISKQRLYLLVAGLFAMHTDSAHDGRSFGASLRQLRNKLGGVGDTSLEGLVGAILNAEGEDLPIRLRHVIARLASNEVAVDYARLLKDLLLWDIPSRQTQRRWAHDYWVARDEEEPDGDGATPGTSVIGGETQTANVESSATALD
jgi:CRISPR system Cascade subunit CasB